MCAIRMPGPINENTTLIDIGMFNAFGITAVYLVRGEKKCLIDGGTHAEETHDYRSGTPNVRAFGTGQAFARDR